MADLLVRELKKTFGRTTVLDSISFEVSDGEFCILLGPSGCGKSTVLRLIAGLEQADEGEIFIGGEEVSNLTPKERDIAMVFQSYALYPHLNVYDNMAFSLKMRKIPRPESDKKVREAAALLDLTELLRRKPRELSGGQRQRVAIGRAIVRNPKLFLFDEPLSNLDAKLRTAMRVEIARLHRTLGSTVVYVTHDQVEAMTLGQKIVLLNEGKIQQTGGPSDLYERPNNLFVAGFIGTPQINVVEGKLTDSDRMLSFRSDAFTMDVWHRRELRKYAGQEVTIGIRPESLLPGKGSITAQVDLVERLGSETIVYAVTGDIRLAARVPADYAVSDKRVISFALHEQGIHFFHRGQRISPDRG